MTEPTGIADSDNPLQEIVEDDARESGRGRYGWLSLTVAAIFGLFYAYDIWEAVGNFIQLPAFYRASGLDTAALPWWVLIIGLVIPPAIFFMAIGIGRRRNVFGRALILLVGLAVVAGMSLGVVALAGILQPLPAAVSTPK